MVHSTAGRFGALMLAFLLTLPAVLLGQEDSDEARFQALLAEYESAQMRLQEVQAMALEQNPQLLERQEALEEMVTSTMAEIDPEVEEGLARLEDLQGEAEEAQASQDAERMETLMMEASTIQQRLQSAQEQALAREEILVAIESFQEELMDGMKDVEPGVEELLEQLQALVVELSAIQARLQNPGG